MFHYLKLPTFLGLGLLAALFIAALALSQAAGTVANQTTAVTVDKTASASAIDCGGTVDVTLTIDAVEPPPGTAIADLDVMLVIDRSGSMSGSGITDAKTAAATFVDIMDDPPNGTSPDGTINGNSQAGLVSFSSSASLDQQLTQDATTLNGTISGLSAGGSTATGDGVNLAQGELTSARHLAGNTPVMVVLTDGNTNAGADPVTAATSAKSAGTEIFTIGLGSGINQTELENMASDPVADHFFLAPTSADLAAIFTAIAQTVTQTSAATNVTVTDTVNAEFTIVAGSVSASKGSVAAVDNTITWTIDKLDTETVTLTYQAHHVGVGGLLPMNTPDASMTYTDHQGNPATNTFPTPKVDVTCATPTPTPTPPAPTATPTATVLAATATPAPTPTSTPTPAVLPVTGGAPPDGSSSGLPWLAAIAGAIAVMAAGGFWFAYQRKRVR